MWLSRGEEKRGREKEEGEGKEGNKEREEGRNEGREKREEEERGRRNQKELAWAATIKELLMLVVTETAHGHCCLFYLMETV